MKLTAKVLVPILAVSISQIAGATPFFSAASLDWNDPAAWTAGVGFPNTFGPDRATINAGHTINYTGGVAGTDGGLSIANNNSVTIRGGLTQTIATTAIRVGEGTGGGTGLLTISAGGTLDTGAAIGLGIGTSFDGVALGDGTMDITQGTLTMGAGAANGGLGVGLDGSTGVLNVGDGIGAADAVVDLLLNNIQMGVGAAFAFAGGGTGTVNIMSDGLIKFGTRDITIGASGGNGTIVISSGGALTGGTGRIVVGNTGSTGTLTTDGTVSSTGEFLVGNGAGSMGLVTQNSGAVSGNDFHVGRGGGNGTYSLNSGTVSFTNEMQIGAGGGSTGLLDITGATSSVVIASGGGDPFARVGSGGGTGTVNITGGGTLNTTNTWFTIGENNGSTGTATVDGLGSTLTSHGLIVGWNGLATGTLNIQNNAVVNNSGHEVSIGRDSGGVNSPTGIINITSGGILNAGNDLRVGHNATGVVNINGGTLNTAGGWAIVGDGGTANGTINLTTGTVNSADWTVIGNNTGAQGALNIGGGTYNVNAGGDSGRLITGRLGTALVNQSGGAVNVGNWFAIGIDPGGNGTYNMSGGTLSVRSNIDVANRGTGTMTITNGNAAGTTITGNSTGGVVNAFNVGADTGGNGTLNIALANGTDRIISRELYAGNNGGTVGVINVNNGTLQTNEWVEIGRNGGTGTVNVSGPTAVWNRGTVGALGQVKDVQIGYNGGTGNLSVSNGGTVNQNWWFNVARGAGSTGHITVDGVGSTINMINGREDGHGGDNNAQLNIGENGTGTLSITGGGTFNQSMFLGGGVTVRGGGEVHIGRNGGSTGTVTVDGAGSSLNTFAREFRVADNNSTGTLNITNGGVVNFSSHNENGTVANGNFMIAESNSANGTVNMNSGTLNVKAWGFDSAWQDNAASSVATLNMMNSTLDIANDSGDHGRLLWGRRGTATINESGGTMHVGNWSVLGVEGGGRGNLNMSNGAVAQFDDQLNIGRLGGIGTVSVDTGSALAVNGEVFVGRDGNGSSGTLNVTGGSTAQLNNNLAIGQGGGGSTGLVNVSGAGSVMNVNGWTTLGRDTGNVAQSSTLNVSNGAVFNHAQHNGGDFLIGWQNGSTGAVNVTNGGTVNYSWWTRVGVDPGSTGSILVDNGSTFHQTGGRTYIGEKASGSLTISRNSHYTVDNSVSDGDVFKVGGGDADTHAGTGVVNIDATSTLSIWDRLSVGDGSNPGLPAQGTINLAGGLIDVFTDGGADFVRIGTRGGHGAVNITGGGVFNTHAGWFTLGDGAGFDGSQGTVTVDGSGSLLHSNGLIVGWNRTSNGTLNITNNAVVTNVGHEVSVGRDFNGTLANSPTGTINISSGGVLNAGNDLRVGHNATGTINLNNGTLNAQGGWTMLGVDNTAANGTVAMTGASQFNITGGRVYIGYQGTGLLSVADTSTVTHTGADQFQVGGNDAGNINSQGTLSVSGSATVSTTNFIRVGHGNAGATPAVGTLNLSGGSINGGNWIGFGHEGGDGTLNMTGGSIAVNNEFYVGIDDNGHTRTTTGTANVLGGTLSVGGGAGFIIGRNGGIGVFNVTGINPVTMTANNESHIGQGGVGAGGSVGNGTLNFGNPNASLTVTNAFLIGQDGGIGVVNQTAGTVSESNQWLTLAAGGGSTGTYNISGGNLNANVLEVGADGAGVLNLSGAATQVVANAVTVGTRSTGVGTINVSGGLFKSNDHIALGGDQSFGKGTLNMTGGVVQTNFVIADAGIPMLNMDGGTFRASSNQGNYLRNFTPANSEILAGGVTFDTNTFNIAAINQFDGAGGLTKINNGTLTLTAQNLYTGVTKLNGGSVNVGSAENAGVSGPLGTSAAANPGSIVFGGGTLQYSAANQNDYSGRFSTAVNQAYRVDTNSQNVTWATSLVSSGGSLTKFGNGTLTLPVANTYTAGTAIHGGTLNINGDAALGFPAGGVLIDNNAILQAAAPVTTNRTITLGAGGGKIDTNGKVVTLDTGSTLTGTSLTVADTAVGGGGVLNIKGTGPQTLAALTTMGGVTNLYSVLGTGSSTITAAATLNIYASQTLASLTIADGVEVTFGDGTGFAPEPVKPSAPFGGGGAGLVPEPGSLGLLMVGALGFIARRRRSR